MANRRGNKSKIFTTPMEAAARRIISQIVWNFSACPTWEDFFLNAMWIYVKIGRPSLPSMKFAISTMMEIVAEWEEIGKCKDREGEENMPLRAEAPKLAFPDHNSVWDEGVTATLGAHMPASPKAWLTDLLQRKRYEARDARFFLSIRIGDTV